MPFNTAAAAVLTGRQVGDVQHGSSSGRNEYFLNLYYAATVVIHFSVRSSFYSL